jgi:hypothetical protein
MPPVPATGPPADIAAEIVATAEVNTGAESKLHEIRR